MPSPLITIAIPTYNRADSYLPQALRGALRQTYRNVEIIVSDNCSTDHTQALVADLADSRVRYFRHEPGIGQKNNYNFCIEQAKGNYVLLLHDDDAIDDDFVSACVFAANENLDAGIIRTGVRIIDAQGNTTSEIPDKAAGLTLEGFFQSWFGGKAPIYCCNTLFNAEKLRAVGGFKSRHFCYADTMAIFRLAAHYPRIDIPEVKASFRIHGNEAGFSRMIAEWCEDSLDLLQLMCELAPQSRQEILRQGRRFFAIANYHRASSARSVRERTVAVIKVMRYFGFRQLPSVHTLIDVLHGTRLYNAVRFLKRLAVGRRPVVAAG